MKGWNHSAGQSAPLGATVSPDGVNFSVFSKGATADRTPALRRALAARPSRVVTARAAPAPDLSLLACVCSRLSRGRSTRIAPMGRLRPNAVCGSMREGARRSRTAWRSRTRRLRPRGGEPARRQRGVRHEERRGRSRRVRLGGRSAARRPFAETVIYEMHVRGFTRHPSSACAASEGAARTPDSSRRFLT